MNILILSWRGPGHPNAGGAEQVTHEHAKGWVKAGHDVTLFTSMYKGAKKEEVMDGVKIKRAGDQFFGVKIYAFLWYFFGKHPKFDLVVDEFHGIPFFTPLYVRTRKLAFIHEVAKGVWKLNPWPRPFNFIPAFFGPLIESLTFKFIYKKNVFMTVSESTKKDLIASGILSKNIRVVFNGVKVSTLKKKFDKEVKKTGIFLGSLSYDKGLLDIVKIIGAIDRKDDNWQFWIVGNGLPEYINYINEKARELGVEKKIKFWGFVSETKKFELLTRAWVLLNPTVHEGWGLVNIEANSVGTPVIGYDVQGMKDSVRDGETGILVDKGDYRALADKALKLVGDKENYQKFQEKCRRWASRFSWDKSTKESLELIESL